MNNENTFINRDRFIQLGVAIGTYRRLRGMSQEQLAEKANISRTYLSTIEAPRLVTPFSLEIFFNIADALDMKPSELLSFADNPEEMFIKKDET